MSKLKILYVSQYFPPEMGAPSARVSELAAIWAASGHQVAVLTGFPNHPTGVVPRSYRRKLWRFFMNEVADGVRIHRTFLVPLPNRKAWERIVNYSSFCWSAMVRGLFASKPDVVIGTSPQLLVGVAGLCLARLKGVPFVFEVRDLWPESLIAVGVSDGTSAMFRILARISKFLYRHADHIVVVSSAFKDYLVEHWKVPAEKISTVVNGVRTDQFHPGAEAVACRQLLNLDDKFTVSFIGTIGNAHGLDTLVDAAKLLSVPNPNILFLVVGEGAEREKLQALLEREHLGNIRLLGQQPRSAIPGLIRASDVCLVMLKRSDVFKTVIPTKMLEFMACGRPVVVGVEGVAREIVEAARAGICIEPEHPGALAAAIVQLYHDAELREAMGQSGARFIATHMSREQTAADYIALLKRLTAQAVLSKKPVQGAAIANLSKPNEEEVGSQ